MTAKEALRECQIFSALNDVELEQIASLAVEKEYEAGTAIFREGDKAEEFFVLQEGKVALQMSLAAAPRQMARRVTVDIVTKNEVLGWSAIVEPNIYTLSAVCLQKAKVLSFSGIKLRGLLLENHIIGYEVLSRLIKVVASRLNDTRQVLVSERLLMPT